MVSDNIKAPGLVLCAWARSGYRGRRFRSGDATGPSLGWHDLSRASQGCQGRWHSLALGESIAAQVAWRNIWATNIAKVVVGKKGKSMFGRWRGDCDMDEAVRSAGPPTLLTRRSGPWIGFAVCTCSVRGGNKTNDFFFFTCLGRVPEIDTHTPTDRLQPATATNGQWRWQPLGAAQWSGGR